MLDRREFLKKAAKMAGGGAFGLAAMHSFGMGAVKDAMGHGILPAVVGSGGGVVSWANWPEDSEATVASSSTFVCFFENVNASENETGQGGGLSGVDLVLTQSGSVAGATGTPPTRQIDGSDDAFTAANGVPSLLTGLTTWSIILKVNTIETTGGIGSYIDFANAGNTDRMNVWWASDQKPKMYHSANSVSMDVGYTANAMPAAGDLWIATWTDGTVTRFGFCATKPTKWSDFAAGDRLTKTAACTFATNMTTKKWLFQDQSNYRTKAKAYYFLLSKLCLIDNAS